MSIQAEFEHKYENMNIKQQHYLIIAISVPAFGGRLHNIRGE